MTRRDALALLTTTPLGLFAPGQPRIPLVASVFRRESAGPTSTTVAAQPTRLRLPGSLPPGVAAILERLLSQPPSSINTDWFGTMPLIGALQWCRRGVKEVEPFVKAWLGHHLQAKEVAQYQGNRAR